MQDYQKRVAEEAGELDSKLEKLNKFLTGEVIGTLPVVEQSRLHRQSEAMDMYLTVLLERIADFE